MFQRFLPLFMMFMLCSISMFAQPNGCLTADIVITDLTCPGAADGIAEITPTNGMSPYTYSINGIPGSDTFDDFVLITGLAVGTYEITIFDSGNCSNSFIFVVNSAIDLLATSSFVNPTCAGGGADGSISIVVTGGTPPYNFTWTNPGLPNTPNVTGLAPGNYECVIDDANGCFTFVTVTLVFSDGPQIINISTSNPACFGEATGSIDISASGGTGAYIYEWSNGETSSFINNLPSGTYCVTVTDELNCSSQQCFFLDEPNELIIEVINITNSSGVDGVIDITVSGGTPPFAYQWSDGTVQADATGLAPGTYEVTVVDANGCFATLGGIVVNPVSLSAVVSNLNCFGDASGSIDLTVGFGNPPYSFLWTFPNGGVSTTEDLIGIEAGTYTVEVTDDLNQTEVATFNLTEPAELVVTLDQIVPQQGNFSTVWTSVTGGVLPYSFLWSDGSTGAFVVNLPPGIYSLTVSDANGCEGYLNDIDVPDQNSGIDGIIQHIDCNGDATGAIEITPTFGTGPYTFAWTGPGGFTADDSNIGGLVAGSYIVTVTDANNQTATNTFFVTEASPLGVSLGFPQLCAGDPIVANITAFGGNPPYSYDWGGLDPNNLPEGPFSVTITDATNCTLVHNDVAAMPDPILLSLFSTSSVCNTANGCIEATVTGGTPPYTFLWANGATDIIICDLPAGTYSVTVVDANGCTAEDSEVVFDIGGPDIVMMGSNVVCNMEGFINVQVTGTAPFTFEWVDDPSITTQNRTGLGPGLYTVVVTDNNGCVETGSFNIEPSIMLEVSSTTADCDSTAGTATVIVTGGAASPTYLWSNNETTATVTNLSPGGYSVTVTDPIPGCRSHKNVMVELDSSCFVTLSGTVYIDDVNQDCVPDAGAAGAGGILITLDSGESTFTNSNGEYAFNVLPGIYDVSMTVNNPQYEAICLETITADGSTADVADLDFFVIYAKDKDLKIYVNKGNARPGFVQSIQICVWNFGSAPADGTLTFVHDPIQEFLSANPTEDSYDLATQTISWNFTNLAPGGVLIFRPKVKLDPSVPLGTPLNLNFEVTPITGDLTPWNNTIHCPMVVTGSYDPNDKAVSPGIGEEGIIYATDTLLTYRIRFQNTGTDTAFTVVIKDELMPELDIETIVPGPSSHDYNLTVEGERTLVFTFDNIMLPDSFVNEPASNGFVFFDVRPIEGTGYGTVIENTAGIYFDFNPPIITNTIVTTFTEYGVGTREVEDFKVPLLVQPNPTSGEAILSYSIEEAQEVWIKIYDLQGRQMATIQTPQRMEAGTHQAVVPESLLPGGVYLIQVETSTNLRGISKMIKMD